MNCKNCQSELKDTYDFCYTCGGLIVKKRITVKLLVAEFMERYLSYDNKFLLLLKHYFQLHKT
jgi:predicted amidophosphoribosyltransferase